MEITSEYEHYVKTFIRFTEYKALVQEKIHIKWKTLHFIKLNKSRVGIIHWR